MKHLRVVVVIHGYYPRVGGAERQMQYLAARLYQRGVDLHILTRRFDPKLKTLEIIDGVPVHRIPVPGPKPVASLIFTIIALLKIARLKPHLIHAHEFLSPATVAVLANRWLRIPFIVTLHGGGSNGDVQKLQRKPSGKIRLNALRAQAKKFIVVSAEIEHELQDAGFDRDQMITIPNAVDTDLFSPLSPHQKTALRIQAGLPADALIAIFTGRLVYGKRVNHLLEIWNNICMTHPKAELLIAGTGSEEENLRKMGVAGVRFLGSVENIAPYLQASDIFVLPSIAEGLSVAMLEAMACGLPALVTDVGGARQVITDRESGWLIQPENLRELEAGINILLGDAGMRSSMGRLGRQCVEESYSIDIAVERLFGLYHEAAGEIQQ
jgi:glycosyltransferase involved in cell wall biosynthesis